MVVTGREFGRRLCEVFGLDANRVRSVRFEADPLDDAAVVVVTFLPTPPELEAIAREYRLIPACEADDDGFEWWSP